MQQEQPIVTADIYDEYSVKFPELKVGEPLPQEIIELEAEKVKAAQEKAAEDERIAAEEKQKADEAAAAQAAEDAKVVAEDRELTYRGLKIVSNGYRTVGEQNFRHIKCEDGTSYDLTEEDYKLEVK